MKSFVDLCRSTIILALLSIPLQGASTDKPWTLQQAIEYALTNNPDINIAIQRIAVAEAILKQAQSAAWPKVQIQSSYTRTDNPMMVFGSILNQRAYFEPPLGPIDFNNVPDIDNLNLKGLVTMPVYTGGQIKNSRQAAAAMADAAREQSLAIRNVLAFEITQAFINAYKTCEFINAANAAVTSYTHNLEVARRHHENGTRLVTDVLDIQVRLSQSQEDLVKAQNAHALVLHGLRTLLGLENVDQDFDLQLPSLTLPSKLDTSSRPELAALRAQIQAAEAEVRRARAGYLPTVGLFASIDYDRGWRSDGDGKSYTTGVVLQWTAFEGNLTHNKVKEAESKLAALREEERKLRLALQLELEQARLNLQEAEKRLQVTEQALALAQESAKLTRMRFEQGLALTTQLIDSETALTVARVRRTEALADYQIAIAALRKAVGLQVFQ